MDEEMELYKKAGELEAKRNEKDAIKQTKERTRIDMAGFQETAMAALYSLLIHDDPAIRLKALGLWMSKMVPSVAAERLEEEPEVVEVGAGFDELAKQIEELKKKAGED